MAYRLLDRVSQSVSGSPGTGAITFGGALAGYQSFIQAGANDSDTLPYLIVDGTNWEYGRGTFSSTGLNGSLARTTVLKTSAQNTSPITVSSKANVSCTLLAEDFANATTLVGLGDVDVTSQSNQQEFVYDQTLGKWINQDVPFILGWFASGAMMGGETLLQFVAPYALKVKATAPGSYAKAATAATASTTVTIEQNGTSIGTVVWGAAATSGAFTVAADIVLAAGDIITFVAPGTADATLADVSVTLAGVRI